MHSLVRRERKRKTGENRLVFTATNMFLLESNVRFLLLRRHSYTVTETIIRRAKEMHVRLSSPLSNKRKNECRTGFHECLLDFSFASSSSSSSFSSYFSHSHDNGNGLSQCIYTHWKQILTKTTHRMTI